MFFFISSASWRYFLITGESVYLENSRRSIINSLSAFTSRLFTTYSVRAAPFQFISLVDSG